MNIEQKIRNNREAFDDVRMPEGSRERFEAALNSSFRLKRSEMEKSTPLMCSRFLDKLEMTSQARKVRLMTWTSVAAAAVAILIMVFGLKNYDTITTQIPQNATADNNDSKLIQMRQMYDERVEEAIIDLESVMENVDDSTKMQINAVIHDLMNMGNVFAEIAPLPEERQMAIAEQIYDNNLRTLELLTDKLNK